MPQASLGIDHLTVLGMPPLDFIDLAAAAGCDSVSLFPDLFAINPFDFPHWSLVTDKALRREVLRRLNDLGVVFALAEGCNIAPDRDVASYAPLLEAFHELGARRVNIVSFEPDLARDFDQTCQLVELAAGSGLRMCAEFSARAGRPKLDAFMLRLEQAGGVAAMIDAMHFFAAGQKVTDLARFDPSRFVQLQICDIRLGEVAANYMEAALHERLPPGEGELPLADLVAALPPGITISMEIPQRALALTGTPHLARVKAAAARCREVIGA